MLQQSTLILGIDVTHPSPTDRNQPSIGAVIIFIIFMQCYVSYVEHIPSKCQSVLLPFLSCSDIQVVGNIDNHPALFGASVAIQRHRRETVVYPEDAVRQRLFHYRQHTGQKPERIIIYRDGVSEGQFKQVSHAPTVRCLQVWSPICTSTTNTCPDVLNGFWSAKINTYALRRYITRSII